MKEFVFKICTGSGTGSGFPIKDSHLIVTNFHVVAGFRKVAFENYKREKYVADVKYINPRIDLAFLEASQTFSDALDIVADHAAAKQGENVHVLGYPLGMPFSVSKGIISAEKQIIGNTQFIQTDAAVNPGNSGGPMINEQDQIVGVTTSKFNNAENMSFAIPSEVLLSCLQTFKSSPMNEDLVICCPGCEAFLTKIVEYCPSCGIELNLHSLFEPFELNPIGQFVESSLTKANVDPYLTRYGYNYWEFYQGSARIKIFLMNDNYLIGTSPVVSLPKQNLLKLYKFLIEFDKKPFYVGISNSVVFLSFRAHTTDVLSGHHKDELAANRLLTLLWKNFRLTGIVWRSSERFMG